ncbi:PA2778 family cysteine peptidase [Kaarinaea lacus]
MVKQQATLTQGGLPFLIFLLLFFAGCASTPQTSRLLADKGNIPQRLELTDVVFFPQEEYQCGPAALATMFHHTGIELTPPELVPEIYLPARKGSLQVEILASTRRHGRIAYRIAPDLQALLSEVSAGNPVLVLQNLALSWAPTWHYAVVVGFDLDSKEVILRSGLEERRKTPIGTFERTWARSNYWGIVVLKPDQLPATAEADRYVKTVIGLEQAKRWHDANTAYQTALSRWPGNQVALMGLGNTYYHLNNFDAAEKVFRKTLETHPDFAPAYNNLAQVLLVLGKLKEAKSFALQAVSLGGPQLDSFTSTLREIEQKLKIDD